MVCDLDKRHPRTDASPVCFVIERFKLRPLKMEAIEQCFPVVLCIILYKVVLTFEFVDLKRKLLSGTFQIPMCIGAANAASKSMIILSRF